MKSRIKDEIFIPPQEIVLGGGHRICSICGETTFGSIKHICRPLHFKPKEEER